MITFEKERRKDEIDKEHLARFRAMEGVLLSGLAQEKTPALRTQRQRNLPSRHGTAGRGTGTRSPSWIASGPASSSITGRGGR